MTWEEIIVMEPGRKMDLVIDEVVFGRTHCQHEADEFGKCRKCNLNQAHWARVQPPYQYSTDIAAAWSVFIAGLTGEGTASIHGDMEDYGRGAILGSGPEQVVTVVIGEWTYMAKAPEAICKAALLAKLAGENQKGEVLSEDRN